MLAAMNQQVTSPYIKSTEELIDFCNKIRDVEWLAIDTEFHRDQNYYADLCLIQIGIPGLAACIDPLTIKDLNPLLDVLYSPDIVKVMHAGRQDLEIFYHMRGSLPQPIFDTQVAAPLLGLDEQMGYGPLVNAMLNVSLDKNHSRADWMRRPMPDAQIQYALDDVIYLAQLYPKMREQLIELGRLDWLNEDFQVLTSPELYQNPPEQAWLRIKAAKKLKSKQLSVVQALATWREQQAQKNNRPRAWICKDDVLIDIARLAPANITELGHIRGIGDGFINRNGKTLLKLVSEAREQKPEPLPEFKFRQKLSAEESALIDALSAIVSLCAVENRLHPSAIASRKNLEALLHGEDNPLLHGWKKQIAGETLQNFLSGDIKLTVNKGKLQVQ